MPAEVETMFYVREVPWHGLGTRVEEAPDSEAALFASGLAWAVEPRPVYTLNPVTGAPVEVPDVKANTRLTDGAVLGIVSGRYTILQNREAFAFTDALLAAGEARYETAGSLRGGRRIWLLARLTESHRILGDEVIPYLCFTSTHDGSGSIRICMTPTRVVCRNTLNIALRSAARAWSTTHVGRLGDRLEEARHSLKLAKGYMAALNTQAEALAAAPVDPARWEAICTALVGERPEDSSPRVQRNYETRFLGLRDRIDTPDLANFTGTGWAAANAVADWIDHSEPLRKTETYAERRFEDVMDGHALLDRACELILA